MKTVRFHRYAKDDAACVYAQPATDSDVVGTLEKGAWIGVIEQQGDMYRVVTSIHDGWIPVGNTLIAPDLTLSIRDTFYQGNQPQYGLIA